MGYLVVFSTNYYPLPLLVLAKKWHFFSHDVYNLESYILFHYCLSTSGIYLVGPPDICAQTCDWNTIQQRKVYFTWQATFSHSELVMASRSKPFQCTLCLKRRRFATDHGLAQHQRALHGVKGIHFVNAYCKQRHLSDGGVNRKWIFRFLKR